MPTVRTNGFLEALVHNGGSWFSMATLPDVCKTPTPGGPVPMPYPNISQASSLQGGTTTVKIDGGNMAAIKGSKFALSSGDEPGTLGGIKSSTFKQASTWLLYSFDVKLEGKNACRFSDKKFQNNENTVDMCGVQPIVVEVDLDEVAMKCGELNQYGTQLKNREAKGTMHRDHVPSKAALKEAAKKALDRSDIGGCIANTIDANALSIVVPALAHRASRTWGQSTAKAQEDAGKLQESAKEDIDKMKANLNEHDKGCLEAYEKAAAKIAEITDKQYKKWFNEIEAACEC